MLKTVLYARFPDARSARRAVEAAEAELGDDETSEITLRQPEHTDDSDLGIAESDGRRGTLRGLLIGAPAGALAALVAGSVASSMQPDLALITLLGAGLGAFFGVLGGSLSALALPDPGIEKLMDHAEGHDTIVTATLPSDEIRPRVERVFRLFGAQEVAVKAI